MSDGEKRIAVRISKMMKGSDKRTRREESRESLTLQKTNKKIIIHLFCCCHSELMMATIKV